MKKNCVESYMDLVTKYENWRKEFCNPAEIEFYVKPILIGLGPLQIFKLYKEILENDLLVADKEQKIQAGVELCQALLCSH